MFNEGLDDEVPQFAHGISYRLILVHPGHYPLLDLIVVLVDANQAELSAPLYQLVGLHHQWLKSQKNKVLLLIVSKKK